MWTCKNCDTVNKDSCQYCACCGEERDIKQESDSVPVPPKLNSEQTTPEPDSSPKVVKSSGGSGWGKGLLISIVASLILSFIYNNFDDLKMIGKTNNTAQSSYNSTTVSTPDDNKPSNTLRTPAPSPGITSKPTSTPAKAPSSTPKPTIVPTPAKTPVPLKDPEQTELKKKYQAAGNGRLNENDFVTFDLEDDQYINCFSDGGLTSGSSFKTARGIKCSDTKTALLSAYGNNYQICNMTPGYFPYSIFETKLIWNPEADMEWEKSLIGENNVYKYSYDTGGYEHSIYFVFDKTDTVAYIVYRNLEK